MRGFNFGRNTKENKKPENDKVLTEKEYLFDLLIHDLTSPLSIASASLDMLLHKPERCAPLSDPQKRLAERTLRNVHKAQNLLYEMIELSRSEEGIFNREFFLIEKVLKDSLIDVLEVADPSFVEKLYPLSSQRNIQEVLRSRGIFTEIKGKYGNSPFCHDSKKIRQILRNLISNAVKYRRNRVRISIEGEEDLLILVEDDGYGIPKEAEDAIFRRFIRLKDKRHGEQPGIGLGLPGVKTLVEAMRGEIFMKSQEGMGTCFTVRIPSFKP